MEEKTLLERKINRLNGLMNRDSKTGEDIKEIGEIRDKLDKYGNAEKHLESLENAIKNEKSKYGKEINFLEKLDQLEKTYTELKLITQKEINEYYDSFNKHFLNRDRKLSAQELLDIFRRGEAANYAQTTKEAEKIAAAKAQKAEEARDFALRQKQQEAAPKAAVAKLTAQRRKAAEQARIAKSGPAIQPGENIVIEAGKGFEQSLRKVISIYRDNFEVANVFGQDLITRTAERYGRVYPNIGTRLKAVINDKINIYNKHVQNVGIPDLSLYNIGKYLNYLDKGILEIMDGQEKVNKLRKLNNSSKGNERTKAQLEKAKAALKRSKARWLDGVKKLVKGEEYNRNVFVELGQAESYDYLNGMNKELLLYKRINKLSQEKHARLTNADWDEILSNFEREHVNANIAYYEKLHSSNN
ncbi:hypothetical protein IJ596_05960 [bacterium]|nr:hypothetical protein [bacterium]